MAISRIEAVGEIEKDRVRSHPGHSTISIFACASVTGCAWNQRESVAVPELPSRSGSGESSVFSVATSRQSVVADVADIPPELPTRVVTVDDRSRLLNQPLDSDDEF
jgi:hypothetical protein